MSRCPAGMRSYLSAIIWVKKRRRCQAVTMQRQAALSLLESRILAQAIKSHPLQRIKTYRSRLSLPNRVRPAQPQRRSSRPPSPSRLENNSGEPAETAPRELLDTLPDRLKVVPQIMYSHCARYDFNVSPHRHWQSANSNASPHRRAVRQVRQRALRPLHCASTLKAALFTAAGSHDCHPPRRVDLEQPAGHE